MVILLLSKFNKCQLRGARLERGSFKTSDCTINSVWKTPIWFQQNQLAEYALQTSFVNLTKLVRSVHDCCVLHGLVVTAICRLNTEKCTATCVIQWIGTARIEKQPIHFGLGKDVVLFEESVQACPLFISSCALWEIISTVTLVHES